MSNKMQTHKKSSPTAKSLLWCLPFIVLPIFMKLLFSGTSFLSVKICTHIEITIASTQKQAKDACRFFSGEEPVLTNIIKNYLLILLLDQVPGSEVHI